MMQHVLDIRNVPPPQLHPDPYDAEAALPPHILKQGLVPHPDDLQPGDLILTAPDSKFVAGARGIHYLQGADGYAPAHARWSHAAVYTGGMFATCEATREGVRLGNLLHAFSGCLVRVRRGVRGDEFVEREVGWRMAAYSVAQINCPYDYDHALSLGRLAMRTGFTEYGFKRFPPSERPEEVICSELFQDAYWRATGVLLQNRLSRETTPAFLSSTPLLRDVCCRWRKLRC